MAMPRRPPLNRGQSMPTYSSTSQSLSYGGVDKTLNSLAGLTLSESKSTATGPRAGDPMRRAVTTSSSDPSRPSSPMVALSEARAHYPTPPHSAGATSGPYTQSSIYSAHSAPTMPRSKSHSSHSSSYSAQSSAYSSQSSPYSSYYSSPSSQYSAHSGSHTATPNCPPPTINPPILRRRSNSSNVSLHIESSSHQYTLLASLGNGYSSDSITIAARKGNAILVVADRWDQEQDCHHEWQVEFGRDADMSSIHAKFENGVLKVTVKRLSYSIQSS